jgi:uncharacterized glyoxalase superfamily protein PhnB
MTAPNLRALELSAALTVSDLDQSAAWYCDVVGFTVDQRHEREGKLIAVSLRSGDVRLLLTQDNGARGAERVKGEGFSLQLTTHDDIDAIAQRVRESSGALDTEPTDTPWGQRMFRFRDPDGFRFTVTSPRPER